MTDKAIWYFKKAEEKQGPVSRTELEALLMRGEIDSSTLICRSDRPDWIPLAECENFNLSTLDEVPTAPLSKKRTRYVRETDEAGVQTRPWVRFWARMVDYSLLYLVFLFLSDLFGALFLPFPPFFTIIILFVWIFIEAILLSTWGTTPGKSLLHITVLDEFQHKLSFSNALNRSFSVWWLGMGIGLPLISLITMLIAAVKLTHTGRTSWDKRSDYHVFHGHVGWIRTLVTILYFTCFGYLAFWSYGWIR